MDAPTRDPWVLAVEAGIRAGANWNASLELGGVPGLDRMAMRWSAHADDAIAEALKGEVEQRDQRAAGPAALSGQGDGDSRPGEGFEK